jgi:2-methylcitrate dehydratase PrpD
VRNPEVTALRDRVSAMVDASMHEDQTRVAIRLKNGKTVEKRIDHAIGSLDRPMSDADLEAKFRALAKGILPAAQADRLIEMCWDIEKLADAGEIARASVPVG